MSQIIKTGFGKSKTFLEIEQCDQLINEDMAALANIVGEADVSTLVRVSPRPKCVDSDTEILLVLRGVNLHPNSDAEDMISARIWLDKDQILVSQRRSVMSVEEVKVRLQSMSSTVEVMREITDGMLGRIERYIFELDEQVDQAEDRALEDPSKKQRVEIMNFRRSVIGLRRYLLPQRETLMTLSRSSSKLLSEGDKQVITDQYYRAARICDQLDAVRERLSLIQEEITAIISDKINQNMYVLSIISLVFLPLAFLTGLFGINVGGMPMFAGGGGALEPTGFWVVALGCVIVAIVIAIIMRIKKWI